MTHIQQYDSPGRGRHAENPKDIPKPGWRDIALRVKDEQSKDNLSIVAAGAAFYSLLAVFPALAAAVAIYGLVADPAAIQQQLQALSGMMPQQAYQIIGDQLRRIAAQNTGTLSLGLGFSLLAALWSANKGMKALITALNIVYDEDESRGFIKLNLWSLLLTIAGIVLALVSLTAILALPALIGNLGMPDMIRQLVVFMRWPLLALVAIFATALLYRYAPDRDEPRWRWVSWGAIIATVLWITASLLFSWYVANFGSYNKTYGSMGAVAILMIWMLLTTYLLLLGGEINAEMEHQTRKDTTEGRPEAMGRRQAHVADTVGKSPKKRE